MELDLRTKSVRILQKVRSAQAILPRSYVLSDNVSKCGDILSASGGFADVWKSFRNGNCVCVKAFRVYTTRNLSVIEQGSQQVVLRVLCAFDDSRQRLFPEIVIWGRLSHPNVLPVLGVSLKSSPLCVITEWMMNRNIMDFTPKHPGVNRLRLVRPISILPSGFDS